MNIAIGALVVILLLMPGAALIKGFYTSLKRKESAIFIPFQDLLLRGIIFSVPIHVSALCVITLLGFIPQSGVLYSILEGEQLTIAQDNFNKFILQFSFYTLSLCAGCFLFGKFLKWSVERKGLDITFHSLRTTNYWYQIFSGKYLENYGVPGRLAAIDFVFIDLITDGDVIYSGILEDFHMSRSKNELELIVLTEVRKGVCYIEDSANGKLHRIGSITSVPGDIFMIPASQVKNINVSYYHLRNENTQPQSEPEIESA